MIIRSLYNVSRQMDVLQKKQENNSANTSNVNTPGFKYQQLVQSTMKEYDLHNNAGGNESNQRQELGSINFGTKIDEAYTDYSQGTLKETGIYSDLAISGRGFFAIELENGQMGFTRNGNFKVDNSGRLVTQEGYPVLGIDPQNKTSYISIENDALDVDKKGYINGTSSKIMAVDFVDYSELENRGNSIYVTGQRNYKPAESDLNQGFIETSNVNILDEMVNMMEVSREFGANQKVLKVINETLQKTVNEVGRI